MYPKKGWILAAVFLVLCSVGCTGQTGETHRLYVQTAGSESQIAETLPTAEQAEWMDADSNAVSTKAVKTKKTTKTTTKKKKSSKKKTTTKQKKETTAKVTTEKAAKITNQKQQKPLKQLQLLALQQLCHEKIHFVQQPYEMIQKMHPIEQQKHPARRNLLLLQK